MPIVHLTDITVKALKPTDSNVTYWSDTTPGFGIRVGKRSRTWTVMRGRTRERVSIGRYPDMSLSDARKMAQRLLIEEPAAPRALKRTFADARDEFLTEHYRGSTSRWPHLVKLMLEKNFKKIEHMQLTDITDDHIGKVLAKLAATPSQHATRSNESSARLKTTTTRASSARSPQPSGAMSARCRTAILTIPTVASRSYCPSGARYPSSDWLMRISPERHCDRCSMRRCHSSSPMPIASITGTCLPGAVRAKPSLSRI